jgi:hypothetical protein
MDHFTKWPETKPLFNKGAKDMMALFLYELICRFACPMK